MVETPFLLHSWMRLFLFSDLCQAVGLYLARAVVSGSLDPESLQVRHELAVRG